MNKAVQLEVSDTSANVNAKDKSCLLKVIRHYLNLCAVDVTQPILVVGGAEEDLQILSACGFAQVVLSNLHSSAMAVDAENIDAPDESYPLVFAHAVLHHCRCPQKALGEMVRVAQKHVFFIEPNDSWALRLLVHLGLSFPYEIAAVADNGYMKGGMRNSAIPNYIYRWTGPEVRKSVSAYHPERQFDIRAYPYWDFYVNERELLLRKESRVADLAKKVGVRNLIGFLRLSQSLLNILPAVRAQGNKFCAAISKGELQPWIGTENGRRQLRKPNVSVL
jgi:SAM-dependent methyltransferase